MLATDYFTKWVIAESYTSIRHTEVIKFLWQNVLTVFGIPKEIITNNGTQFRNEEVFDFCDKYGIELHRAAVYHAQSNGQAEASNKIIFDGIKKSLKGAKGRWPELLPQILWAYRATKQSSTGETPYSMVYGHEAMIPVEIEVGTARRELFTDHQHRGGHRPVWSAYTSFYEPNQWHRFKENENR